VQGFKFACFWVWKEASGYGVEASKFWDLGFGSKVRVGGSRTFVMHSGEIFRVLVRVG